jgi:predicted PurR-regulated permease PerM
VCVGFTVSPQVGLSALVFLIVLHKLEYFLNSKVIGERIKNPVWLTLVGLIVGERILGIPGIILAPVFLHFFRVEASAIPVASEPTSNAKSQ